MSDKPKRKRKPAAPKPETEEVVEDVTPITLDDLVEKVTGIVKNFKTRGVTTIARRLLSGLEGFSGGLTGDDEKKPPRKG